MTLDLRTGAEIMIPVEGASNKGSAGKLVGKIDGNYMFELKEDPKDKGSYFYESVLGAWWVNAALRGAVQQIPLVNVHPQVRHQSEVEAEKAMQELDINLGHDKEKGKKD
jgi:hypothetical protein